MAELLNGGANTPTNDNDESADWLKLLDGGKFKAADLEASQYAGEVQTAQELVKLDAEKQMWQAIGARFAELAKLPPLSASDSIDDDDEDTE